MALLTDVNGIGAYSRATECEVQLDLKHYDQKHSPPPKATKGKPPVRTCSSKRKHVDFMTTTGLGVVAGGFTENLAFLRDAVIVIKTN